MTDYLFLADLDGKIVGSAMAGYDGHRGWLYSLAVLPDHRQTGIGTQLAKYAEQILTDLGCVKFNLQVRSTNPEVIAFYESLGFQTEQIISMGKRLGEFKRS